MIRNRIDRRRVASEMRMIVISVYVRSSSLQQKELLNCERFFMRFRPDKSIIISADCSSTC